MKRRDPTLLLLAATGSADDRWGLFGRGVVRSGSGLHARRGVLGAPAPIDSATGNAARNIAVNS
jgi:hypothetical protein